MAPSIPAKVQKRRRSVKILTGHHADFSLFYMFSTFFSRRWDEIHLFCDEKILLHIRLLLIASHDIFSMNLAFLGEAVGCLGITP